MFDKMNSYVCWGHWPVQPSFQLVLVFLSLTFISGLPAPQSGDSGSDYGDSGSDYGDYGEDTEATEERDGAGDILRAGASLAGSLLALLGQKVRGSCSLDSNDFVTSRLDL